MISSKTHAIIDYIVGVLLIAAPFLFGFANGGPAQMVPTVLGAGTIIYSLITRYEYSAAKVIPYKVHLGIDALAGLLLLVSPWLFGFADLIWWPHVLVGVMELGVVAMSWSRADTTARV
ncbi:MAG TPA: hypothetical protein VGN60_10195 [Devosia sp.]|jgi:hypothetical protein|nr:hypothetical protein [Devosia sp.]